MSKAGKFDREDRLIDVAARCIKTASALPQKVASQHLMGQLTRSGTSPAWNYGEAPATESRSLRPHVEEANELIQYSFPALIQQGKI